MRDCVSCSHFLRNSLIRSHVLNQQTIWLPFYPISVSRPSLQGHSESRSQTTGMLGQVGPVLLLLSVNAMMTMTKTKHTKRQRYRQTKTKTECLKDSKADIFSKSRASRGGVNGCKYDIGYHLVMTIPNTKTQIKRKIHPNYAICEKQGIQGYQIFNSKLFRKELFQKLSTTFSTKIFHCEFSTNLFTTFSLSYHFDK